METVVTSVKTLECVGYRDFAREYIAFLIRGSLAELKHLHANPASYHATKTRTSFVREASEISVGNFPTYYKEALLISI